MSVRDAEKPETAKLRREKLVAGLIIGLALCVGIAVRVRVVQLSEGLVRDDAAVAISVVQRSEWDLLRKPLDEQQVAPIGYILVTKQFTRWFGDDETALRMPALVASILSLVFYLILARQVLPVWGQVIGLVLMAFCWQPIMYAARVKPYTFDVLIAVILWSGAIWALRRPPTLGSYAALAILGLLGITFSMPAVFLLGGIGLTLIARSVITRPREAIGWIAVSFLWLAGFVTLYLTIYRVYTSSHDQLSFYASYFAPFPPRSITQIKWYYDHFFSLFQLTAGLNVGELAGVIFLFGMYIIATKGGRPLLGLFLVPLIVTLAASALKKYPFGERLMLFSCPMLFTIIAAGISGISRAEPSTRFLRMLLAAMLLIYPSYTTAKLLVTGPFDVHDIKPALDHLADHWQEGDVVYVHTGADMLYRYYVNALNYKDLRGKPAVIGIYPGTSKDVSISELSISEQLSIYGKDIEPVQGRKRVWFVFAMGAPESVPIFDQLLDTRGTRLEKFQGRGSVILLYDLSPEARPKASAAIRPEPLPGTKHSLVLLRTNSNAQ